MEQTNRTILFEELNPDKENLLTYMIGDDREGVTDEVLYNIHRNLTVTSFKECVEKFRPVLYLLLDTANRRAICTRQVQESRQALRDGYREIREICIDENHILLQHFIKKINRGKSLTNMQGFGRAGFEPPECGSSEKGSSDMGSYLTDFIIPFQQETKFREQYTKVLQLFVSGKRQESVAALQKFCGEYDDALILLHLLPILAGEEIEFIQKGNQSKPMFVEEHEAYQIEIAGISNNFLSGHIELDAKETESYESWLEESLKDYSGKNRELLLELFKIRLYGARHQEMRLEELREEYLSYSGKIIEIFWGVCEPLLEKLLGVYAFFDQYQVREPLMQPELIISNFAPEQIRYQKNKRNLQRYLSSVNEKIYSAYTIWYAIVPRLEYQRETAKAGIRQRFEGNIKETSFEVSNSLESFAVLAELLSQYQIQIFASPVLNRRTVPRWLCEHGVFEWCEYEETLLRKEGITYQYPCFPNFLLSSDLYKEIKRGGQEVWIKLPGVEASYVAAGMYAAFQCPHFLRQQFGRCVDLELPGVSFRINEENRNVKIPATLKAGIFSLPKDVIEEVKRRCIGIFFAPAGGREIILLDRTMQDWQGEYDCVSTVQTVTYLERKIRRETQDFKPELVKQFFEKRPGSLMEAWCRNPDLLNALFHPGEGMEYHLDEEGKACIFEIRFLHADYRHTNSLYDDSQHTDNQHTDNQHANCQRKVYLNK